MLDTVLSYFKDFLYILPIIIISLTFHECAHGYVAYKLGDPTAKEQGRLTLNPLKHLDPLGFVLMILLRFGWAKPVPVNPLYFKSPRKGMLITAAAGPISNLALAVVSSLIVAIMFSFVPFSPILVKIDSYLMLMTYINIGLAVFNLIPIYPLDGSRILGYFMPNGFNDFFRRYGDYVTIAFIVLVIATDVLDNAIFFVQSNVSEFLVSMWMNLFSLLPF